MSKELAAIMKPPKLWSRSDLGDMQTDPPQRPGVNAWWFDDDLGRSLPDVIIWRGWRLLYVGSTNNLQRRIHQHFERTARQSTLRLTVGSILEHKLKLAVTPMAGDRQSFGETEHKLSAWLSRHARVSWVESRRATELKSAALLALTLPLNLRGAADRRAAR